jgi:hypothetical protein
VVGVRSIGTGLSAVVGAALRGRGVRVRRVTVRPAGHPFAREVHLPAGATRDAEWALVVDEGPGLSGSSMAAAVRALHGAGMALHRIVLMPGHGGEPGPRCTPGARALWRAVPRVVGSAEEPVFAGRSLARVLGEQTERLLGRPTAAVQEVSVGRWRGHVWGDPARWPATDGLLGRPKYLCRACDGRSILWKFAGLAVGADGETGVERDLRRLERLAALGWSDRPLGAALGFIAMPWVEGERVAVASRHVLSMLSAYIADAAGGPRSAAETREGFDALAAMLMQNTRESLGRRSAQAAERLSEGAAAELPAVAVAAYGDGRMAPHEWVVTPRGPRKLGPCGHDADHTMVGVQPWWWDLAGATVEWGLSESQRARVRRGPGERGMPLPAPRLERFYIAAYGAFRLGVCDLAAGWAADEGERGRIGAARARYAAGLASVLAPFLSPARSPASRSRPAPTARTPRGAPR